jgi:AraC-like DNA-binding protein
MTVSVQPLIADAPIREGPYIGIQAIHPLTALLRVSGFDLDCLLSAFGLTQQLVDNPDHRIPLALLDPLWQSASELAGDPDLGLHAAELVNAGSFGMLSYLGVTSPTWGIGLERVSKYFRVFSDASGYRVEIDKASARAIAFREVATPGPVRQRVEFTVAVLYCYGRACVDGAWAVDDVFFEHGMPGRCEEHRRIFGRLPHFDQLCSGFSFRASLLDRPLKSCEPGLHRILERQADQSLAAAHATPSVTAALRALLRRADRSCDLSLPRAAHDLGMSARTLQRRLREEGTTHARLVDEVRWALASEMLARDLAISEVAFALGFSEPAAFHHAFKRWTGLTPSEFRRAVR